MFNHFVINQGGRMWLLESLKKSVTSAARFAADHPYISAAAVLAISTPFVMGVAAKEGAEISFDCMLYIMHQTYCRMFQSGIMSQAVRSQLGESVADYCQAAANIAQEMGEAAVKACLSSKIPMGNC